MPVASEVLIRIRVRETEDGCADESRTEYRGRLLEREGTRILHYEDLIEGEKEAVQTTVFIRKDRVEIHRRGPADSRLVYIPGAWTACDYRTPLGSLDLRIYTDKCRIRTLPGRIIKLVLSYRLEIRGQDAGQRDLTIEALPSDPTVRA